MNNRLQQFLEFENLTPARLADMLGVQRSGLSHILSGRNKPGYEFIHKLLTRFPAINADWLITGKGKPYKEMDRPLNNGNSPTGTSPDPTNTFSPEKKNQEEVLLDDDFGDLWTQKNDFSDSLPENDRRPSYDKTAKEISNQINRPDSEGKYPPENPIDETRRTSAREKREIKRVIVFYKDGSFEELFPAGSKIEK